MPKTKLGTWSVGLTFAMVALFGIGLSLPSIIYNSTQSGNTLLDDIVNRPLLALSMLTGVGASISALITGLVALLKRKERAILVYGSTLIGAAVVFFVIALFLFPE